MEGEFKMPGLRPAKPNRNSNESSECQSLIESPAAGLGENISLGTISVCEDVLDLSTTGSNGAAPITAPSDPPPATKSKDRPSSNEQERKPHSSAAEKQAKYAEILASLKYQPPETGAPSADSRYSFEVLKTGTIVDRVKFSKLDNKGFYVIGRVPACDVVAENPTVSRTHAVLQFVKCPEGDKKKKVNQDHQQGTDKPCQTGIYLFDLNSTHGSFINKNQVFPQKYYRLHVGHVLKFGNSSRLYVLLGPSEDEEEESDKSVTELQNEKLQKELQRKRLEEQGLLIKPGEAGEIGAEDGCSWGMGDDADEESDLRENPFAINFEESETFDNPKKTLRGWFEREGFELVYDCREKAPGQFICRINLPIDGPGGQQVFAEMDVKGKKKEAVHQAALQACQILDKYGVLRQSHTESKSKRKERDWEDQDYYSSDEDTFLDRTGSVEKKREKRMKIAGKIADAAETYDSLNEKAKNLQKEMDALQSQINNARSMNSGEEDVDLDDYVKYLKTGADVKKLKSKLREHTEELKRVNKLLNIAKPASLPIHLTLNAKPKVEEDVKVKISNSSPITQTTEINKKEKIDSENVTSEITTTSAFEDCSSEESINKIKPESKLQPHKKLFGPILPAKPFNIPSVINPVSSEEATTSSIPMISSKATKKDSIDDSTKKSVVLKDDSESSDDNEVETIEEKSKDPEHHKKKRNRQRHKVNKDTKFDYDDSDPKYSTWVPPKDQQGDGRTALNEKLGY